MQEKKYVLELSGTNVDGNRVLLRPSSIEKLNLANWGELTFSIRKAKTHDSVAFVRFIARGKSLASEVPYLSTSGESKTLAVNFFRTYRQSPFRLVFFSALSFFEKRGKPVFFSGNGFGDNGAAHKKQIRQRIIEHIKESGKYNSSFHRAGVFPRVEISELRSVLAANRAVPQRLLPPESVLRAARAKSYAHLELERMGKSKYKAMRKIRVAQK